jgi:hypothetical protein
MQAAVAELRAMIESKYPNVEFRVYRGEDPIGVYIEVMTPTDDTLEIGNLISDRELQMQLDEGLAIYVVPGYRPPSDADVVITSGRAAS